MTTNPFSLTEGEMLVLKHMAAGRCTKEIAGLIGKSPKTVEYYRANLQNKTKCYDTASLTKLAIKNNLATTTIMPAQPEKPSQPKAPAREITSVRELGQALLKGASLAAAGEADVLQINALCQCSDALIRLARLQMDTENKTLAFLD
jgi:DNA-binding CsgD family transcriptional regulator